MNYDTYINFSEKQKIEYTFSDIHFTNDFGKPRLMFGGFQIKQSIHFYEISNYIDINYFDCKNGYSRRAYYI